MLRKGRHAWPMLADQSAFDGNIYREVAMLRRVDDVGPAAQHRQGRPAGIHTATVGSPVRASGQSGNNQHAAVGELATKTGGDFEGVGRRGA